MVTPGLDKGFIVIIFGGAGGQGIIYIFIWEGVVNLSPFWRRLTGRLKNYIFSLSIRALPLGMVALRLTSC